MPNRRNRTGRDGIVTETARARQRRHLRRLLPELEGLENRTLLTSLSDALKAYDTAVQTITNASSTINTIIQGTQGVFSATPSLLGDNLGDLLGLGNLLEVPFQTTMSPSLPGSSVPTHLSIPSCFAGDSVTILRHSTSSSSP